MKLKNISSNFSKKFMKTWNTFFLKDIMIGMKYERWRSSTEIWKHHCVTVRTPGVAFLYPDIIKSTTHTGSLFFWTNWHGFSEYICCTRVHTDHLPSVCIYSQQRCKRSATRTPSESSLTHVSRFIGYHNPNSHSLSKSVRLTYLSVIHNVESRFPYYDTDQFQRSSPPSRSTSDILVSRDILLKLKVLSWLKFVPDLVPSTGMS